MISEDVFYVQERLTAVPVGWEFYADWQLERRLTQIEEELRDTDAVPMGSKTRGYLMAWKGEIRTEIAKRNNYIVR